MYRTYIGTVLYRSAGTDVGNGQVVYLAEKKHGVYCDLSNNVPVGTYLIPVSRYRYNMVGNPILYATSEGSKFETFFLSINVVSFVCLLLYRVKCKMYRKSFCYCAFTNIYTCVPSYGVTSYV
jgi:hypothetical protein